MGLALVLSSVSFVAYAADETEVSVSPDEILNIYGPSCSAAGYSGVCDGKQVNRNGCYIQCADGYRARCRPANCWEPSSCDCW
ncbi:MAG: hypothetical protein JST04_03120 [Bdellovibrionales bacterium]|nr:hypothetical protein [Bdellovibrionales bacterium]